MDVRFSDPARVSLLAHIFASILRRGLADAGVARKVSGLGRIGVEMAGMAITAEFGDAAVTLSGGRTSCRAWVGGGMSDLLEVCLRGAVIKPWLEGRVRWGGNPFALLKLLSVLAAARK
ncbi:MAG: hypothetical protein IT452_10380 [Planctomycetia bacterium]|nr:hypothetical protein [Planctomycetia bacterium]